MEVRNYFWFDCLVSFNNLSILPCKWWKLISILSSIYWFVKVASILIPQAKPLYPCLLFVKTLFSPDGRSVFMNIIPFSHAQNWILMRCMQSLLSLIHFVFCIFNSIWNVGEVSPRIVITWFCSYTLLTSILKPSFSHTHFNIWLWVAHWIITLFMFFC